MIWPTKHSHQQGICYVREQDAVKATSVSICFLLFAFCFLFYLSGCGSSGSGLPTGPNANPNALTFSYCRTAEVNGETHVQWRANRPTRGDVRYGEVTPTSLLSESQRADSHDVVLICLLYSTHYVFELTATDSAGDTALFSGAFTTPARSTLEPLINGLTVSEITESSALVSWRTDVPATTILYYGSAALADSVTNDSLAFLHDVHLTGLVGSAVYHLRPEAIDSAGVRGIGQDTTFATPAQMMIGFSDTTITLGDTVRLPLYILDAADLAALHVGISFQPGSVEVVELEQGPFYTDNGGFMFFNNIENSTGRVIADWTWSILYQGGQRTGTDANGDGIVAYIVLRGLSAGDAHFAFVTDSSYALDAFGQERTCRLVAGTIEIHP
jgi:hypothetical protein